MCKSGSGIGKREWCIDFWMVSICRIWGSEFQKFEETNAVWYDAFLLDINRRVGGGYAGGRGEIEPAHVDIFSDLLLTGKM